MAATNKCLADSNKTRTAPTTTKKQSVHRSPVQCADRGRAVNGRTTGAAPMRNSTHTVLGQSRADRDASLAEKDKCLAQSNKSGMQAKATKKREIRQQS
jgi:hypothetical protein